MIGDVRGYLWGTILIGDVRGSSPLWAVLFLRQRVLVLGYIRKPAEQKQASSALQIAVGPLLSCPADFGTPLLGPGCLGEGRSSLSPG